MTLFCTRGAFEKTSVSPFFTSPKFASFLLDLFLQLLTLELPKITADKTLMTNDIFKENSLEEL